MEQHLVERTIRIDASPVAVWQGIRDFAGHGQWMPGGGSGSEYMSWSGDPNTPGTVRRFAAPGHPVFAEQLNRIDEDRLELAYSIVESPLSIEDHEALMAVRADGDGAIASWSARFTSDVETANALENFMGTQNFAPGLAGLKAFIEEQHTDTTR